MLLSYASFLRVQVDVEVMWISLSAPPPESGLGRVVRKMVLNFVTHCCSVDVF